MFARLPFHPINVQVATQEPLEDLLGNIGPLKLDLWWPKYDKWTVLVPEKELLKIWTPNRLAIKTKLQKPQKLHNQLESRELALIVGQPS